MRPYLPVLFAAMLVPLSSASGSVFMIGNSLTWDTQPSLLTDATWQIRGNQNLKSFYDNPTHPGEVGSIAWEPALTENNYDYVTVQPFTGTTFAEDVAYIDHWMSLQPNATFVLHTGWAAWTIHKVRYESTAIETWAPSPAYFGALRDALRDLHPDQEIRISRAAEVLHSIAVDIEAGEAPFSSLQELYRDNIHMSYGDGRYLMHNAMRLALDQGLNLTPDEEATETRQYVNAKLRELLATEDVLPGDFNGDGTVNLADYTVWRDNLGQPTEAALGNAGTGTNGVAEDDYQLWRDHFGAAAGVVDPTAVPEPSAGVIAILLGTLVAMLAIQRSLATAT